jgi:NAD(P)-dependent dehydrogenase (short-subunit alcohol dehydrogenase family)
MTSPAMGRMAAWLITHGRAPANLVAAGVDVAAIAPGRFRTRMHKGRAVAGRGTRRRAWQDCWGLSRPSCVCPSILAPAEEA